MTPKYSFSSTWCSVRLECFPQGRYRKEREKSYNSSLKVSEFGEALSSATQPSAFQVFCSFLFSTVRVISALASIAQVGNGRQVPCVCLGSYDLPHMQWVQSSSAAGSLFLCMKDGGEGRAHVHHREPQCSHPSVLLPGWLSCSFWLVPLSSAISFWLI